MLNDIEARPTISKNHIPEREFCKFIIYISFKKFVQVDKEKKNTIFHKKTRVGRPHKELQRSQRGDIDETDNFLMVMRRQFML